MLDTTLSVGKLHRILPLFLSDMSVEIRIKFWIFLLTITTFPDCLSAVTETCPPAEEYKAFTLTCPTDNKGVIWQLGNGATLAVCEKSLCRLTNQDLTTATWNSSFSTFTFKNMSRTSKSSFNLQEFRCSQFGNAGFPDVMVSVCKLAVYVRPDKPRCGNPTLSTTTVSVTCNTQKVYPEAGCEFYNKNTTLHGVVTYINGSLADMTTDYYKPQCSITLRLGSDLGPGVHQFKVLMYPDIPEGKSFGVESNWTSVINLALPSASLSTSCFGGVNVTENYIKEGTTVRCQCNRDKDGNPPGWVEWVDIFNQLISKETTDKTAVLKVSAERNGLNPHFVCRAVSALDPQATGLPFKREIAFGPISVRVLHDNGLDHYDLCPPDNSIDVTVYCEVPVTNVNPEPVFIVSINSLSSSKETNVTNTTHYRRKSVFTLTSGKHKVTCLATNSEFPTIQKQETLSVEIRGPPTSEPRIRLANGNLVLNGETANVVEGDDITCYVEGGYPPTDVTLTCQSGNNSVTVVQGTMEVSMDISNHNDKINCTCTSDQRVSMCLNNKISWFTFHEIKESKASSSGVEAAIIGSVVGGFLIIVLVVVIFCVLKRKGKLSSCPKSCSGHQRKQLSDSPTQVDDPNSHTYLNQHQNEDTYLNQHQNEVFDFDGYEVPVTPHLTSDYENSLAVGNTDNVTSTINTTPGRIGKGDTVYENSL